MNTTPIKNISLIEYEKRHHSLNSAEHYTTRWLEPRDVDQYNALLRYTFQVTEEELTAPR